MCANPDCPTPDSDGGQWQFIPAEFREANAPLRSACVCKKPACKRWAGLAPPPAQPGRKRKATASAGSVPVPEEVVNGAATSYYSYVSPLRNQDFGACRSFLGPDPAQKQPWALS